MNELVSGFLWVLGALFALFVSGAGLLFLLFLIAKSVDEKRPR